jgi:hypothetical protein
MLHTQEVTGSSPVAPTININYLQDIIGAQVDGCGSRCGIDLLPSYLLLAAFPLLAGA